MSARSRYDTVVVGAGPAGCAAAYHLAVRGRRVLLLEAQRFPRAKVCGDALTQRAVRILADMGVLDSLPPAQRMRGARIHMRGRGWRDFDYAAYRGADSHCLVVPRVVLDEAICARAVAVGAELWEEAAVTAPIIESGRVVGVRVGRRGRLIDVRASVVIAADGARSRLARTAGLLREGDLGIGIRGYLTELDGMLDRQEIFLPLDDVGGRDLLPSYGWINPTGAKEANIGVGLFGPGYEHRAQDVLHSFVTRLRGSRAAFADGRLRGGWAAAPFRLDFSPDRCVADGILLVGDAAGLVNPFTGEGISYALESGRTAAEVVDRALVRDPLRPDLLDYALLLEHSYSGWLAAGRRSSHRYQFVWRVLESTFDSERVPFALCRRAVLLPEGLGELRAHRSIDDVAALMAPGMDVRADLLGVGDLMTSAVRDEWPFLARLVTSGRGEPGVPLRPALLLLLTSCFGDRGAGARIELGASVELGALAALVQLGVENTSTPHSSWGNRFAILVSDLLMAKSLHLAILGGQPALQLISNAVTRVCTGRIRERRHAFDVRMTENQHMSLMEMQTASAFELPCRLGALTTGADPKHAAALADYGRALGVAYRLTEDIRTLTEVTEPRDETALAGLRDGALTHSMLAALRHQPDGRLARLIRDGSSIADDIDEIAAIVEESGALDVTRALAREYADRAADALAVLPEHPARASLFALTDYAVTRHVPQRPDLMSAFR
ncbi:geranylgeranyl reductase family [Nocardia amikacinitolerans]|uniref:Geranylgeranyl reductase family n=1 Tax=Nocardia amikacinitolerans TaxID=756689 RepID=A0A285KXB1_9NOCA|nr:geranylgeranyl reductase family protein [Nocardia amikacinitolerans]MCP2276143.1 geranylgeranyl reductase family [Nocardia amikacinitolerans]MCP2294414.1 geranylgeranyl reductase family [Nocardia amikacinitolerans]SNY77279.1 geranylgeranyl reductase family [Nocardia amikacinitolerans]